MFNFSRKFKKYFFRVWRSKRGVEIDPDEIFLDSSNLPDFNVHQFEGRIEKPIPKKTLVWLGSFFLLIILLFSLRLWVLQVEKGEAYSIRSDNNILHNTTIFSSRGMIYDRDHNLLAWNAANPDNADFALREYATTSGFGHILGYVKYPSQDSSGLYYTQNYVAKDGVEAYFNDIISGKNGKKIVETNALGRVQSENIIQLPVAGNDITLTIDSGLQQKAYEEIKSLALDKGFSGGTGAIMDIKTGQIMCMVSYPDYDPNIMSNSQNSSDISALLKDPGNPFLNRFIDGLYTPGSIVKPFMALAALNEHIIDPMKQILSTGSISIPNPFDPTKKSVFNDWRPQGWVDMRHALSVSSDVYFYEVGGGYQDQPGLGIDRIDKYMKLFGYGQKVPDSFFSGPSGVIPDQQWKEDHFNGEEWRIGDTYHTSIGQYGVQVTPMQALIGVGTIANDGVVPQPTLILNTAGDSSSQDVNSNGNNSNQMPAKIIPIPQADFQVVKEGMRLSVLEGVSKAVNIPDVEVAAKTGTAELGTQKKFINSLVMGFFPYQSPHYAFLFVMEHGPYVNTIGAPFVVRQLLGWISANRPQYFK